MQMYLKFCQFFVGYSFCEGVLKVQVGLPREHVRELALHVLDILVYWLGFVLYIYMYRFVVRAIFVFLFAASVVCPYTCAESFAFCVGLPVWLGLGNDGSCHAHCLCTTMVA